jgi:hypothetical protein
LTVEDRHVGSLVVATILGNEYARELARCPMRASSSR